MNDIKSRILSYLAKHDTLSLATVSPEGNPCAASLFYANEGFYIYFVSSPHSLHGRNIREASAVSATVSSDKQDWKVIRGLQIYGNAFVTGEDEQYHAEDIYFSKFPYARQIIEERQKIEVIRFYKFVPRHIKMTDNSVAFGQKSIVFHDIN